MLQWLVGVIPLTEWKRFQEYAKRIQVLIYYGHQNIHSSVYLRLVERSGSYPILPCLRSLHWNQAAKIDPAASLFITPSLRSAVIFLNQTDWGVFEDICGPEPREKHSVQWFLESIANETPSLTRLCIVGPCPSRWFLSVKQFQRLRNLDLGDAGLVDHELLDAMSSFQYLSEASMHVGESPSGYNVQRPAFRSLNTLRISGTPSSINTVLNAVDSNNLFSLAVVTNSSVAPELSWSCSEILRSKFRNSLRRIHMRLPLASEAGASPYIMDALEPLLGLHSLDDLSLEIDGGVRIRDSDIHTMASSWRLLQRFYLWRRSVEPDPSLQSLTAFAYNCPHLLELALVLDARLPVGLAASHTSGHPLRSLRLLGNVCLGDPDPVAPFISCLFPSLRHFEAYAWDSRVNALWEYVKYSIPSLQSQRQRSKQNRRKGVCISIQWQIKRSRKMTPSAVRKNSVQC